VGDGGGGEEGWLHAKARGARDGRSGEARRCCACCTTVVGILQTEIETE
jgi:hypothetical protein